MQNGIEIQPGERFDVLVTWNQPPGIYHLRVDRYSYLFVQHTPEHL